LNFNCQEYGIQKQIIIERSNDVELVSAERLFNMLLKFSNLKKIGLISADLQPGDSSKLQEILSQSSKTLQCLNLGENENITNAFLQDAFSVVSYDSLEILDVSKTQVNQDCQIYAQFKNLTHLIMKGCFNLDASILQKLSESGNLVNTLEVLDIRGSNLSWNQIQNDSSISKFKKLKLMYQ